MTKTYHNKMVSIDSDNSKTNAVRSSYEMDVDYGIFIKVFNSDIFKNLYKSLTVNSKAVLGWFILVTPYNDDVIKLSNDDIKFNVGLGINAVRMSINELIEKKIIDRVNKSKKSEDFHSYYINAAYFFNGKKSNYYAKVFEVKNYSEQTD